MDFFFDLIDTFCFLLFFVGLIHLFVPTIIALTRIKFRRKTLKLITVINALHVLTIQGFLFLNISLGGLLSFICIFSLQAFAWSFASYGILKRGSEIDSPYLKKDPNRIVECKSCGYRSKKFFVSCPKCGNYTKQYVYLSEENPIADNENSL